MVEQVGVNKAELDVQGQTIAASPETPQQETQAGALEQAYANIEPMQDLESMIQVAVAESKPGSEHAVNLMQAIKTGDETTASNALDRLLSFHESQATKQALSLPQPEGSPTEGLEVQAPWREVIDAKVSAAEAIASQRNENFWSDNWVNLLLQGVGAAIMGIGMHNQSPGWATIGGLATRMGQGGIAAYNKMWSDITKESLEDIGSPDLTLKNAKDKDMGYLMKQLDDEAQRSLDWVSPATLDEAMAFLAKNYGQSYSQLDDSRQLMVAQYLMRLKPDEAAREEAAKKDVADAMKYLEENYGGMMNAWNQVTPEVVDQAIAISGASPGSKKKLEAAVRAKQQAVGAAPEAPELAPPVEEVALPPVEAAVPVGTPAMQGEQFSKEFGPELNRLKDKMAFEMGKPGGKAFTEPRTASDMPELSEDLARIDQLLSKYRSAVPQLVRQAEQSIAGLTTMDSEIREQAEKNRKAMGEAAQQGVYSEETKTSLKNAVFNPNVSTSMSSVTSHYKAGRISTGDLTFRNAVTRELDKGDLAGGQIDTQQMLDDLVFGVADPSFIDSLKDRDTTMATMAVYLMEPLAKQILEEYLGVENPRTDAAWNAPENQGRLTRRTFGKGEDERFPFLAAINLSVGGEEQPVQKLAQAFSMNLEKATEVIDGELYFEAGDWDVWKAYWGNVPEGAMIRHKIPGFAPFGKTYPKGTKGPIAGDAPLLARSHAEDWVLYIRVNKDSLGAKDPSKGKQRTTIQDIRRRGLEALTPVARELLMAVPEIFAQEEVEEPAAQGR